MHICKYIHMYIGQVANFDAKRQIHKPLLNISRQQSIGAYWRLPSVKNYTQTCNHWVLCKSIANWYTQPTKVVSIYVCVFFGVACCVVCMVLKAWMSLKWNTKAKDKRFDKYPLCKWHIIYNAHASTLLPV